MSMSFSFEDQEGELSNKTYGTFFEQESVFINEYGRSFNHTQYVKTIGNYFFYISIDEQELVKAREKAGQHNTDRILIFFESYKNHSFFRNLKEGDDPNAIIKRFAKKKRLYNF